MAAAIPSRALISSKCGCSAAGTRRNRPPYMPRSALPLRAAGRPRRCGGWAFLAARTDVHAARRAGCVGGRQPRWESPRSYAYPARNELHVSGLWLSSRLIFSAQK
jgi:hypothetical protein